MVSSPRPPGSAVGLDVGMGDTTPGPAAAERRVSLAGSTPWQHRTPGLDGDSPCDSGGQRTWQIEVAALDKVNCPDQLIVLPLFAAFRHVSWHAIGSSHVSINRY